jgi:hypothetical protein
MYETGRCSKLRAKGVDVALDRLTHEIVLQGETVDELSSFRCLKFSTLKFLKQALLPQCLQ